MLLKNRITSQNDTFSTDFKNIFITGTTGFAFRVACFWYLDHHKAPVTAILGIELHDGMRSRRRPRKEIQYDIFAFSTGGLRDYKFNKFQRLGVRKNLRAAK